MDQRKVSQLLSEALENSTKADRATAQGLSASLSGLEDDTKLQKWIGPAPKQGGHT
jgi:hypothetical protein